MEVCLIIGDHVKHIEMAVVDLGKTDFFLGIDWLCYELPDAEDEHIEERLEEGECLFYMDWNNYVWENAQLCST